MLGSIISAGAGLLGGMMSASASKSAARKQVELQREFAQNGIRWKVADAKAAGLHPLAALGAQTTSYQPVSVGDTSMGSALSEMGQNISRSIDATLTRQERREQERQRQELLQRQLDMQDMQFFAGMEKEKAQIEAIRAQTALDLKRASVLGQPSGNQPGVPLRVTPSTGYSADVQPAEQLYQRSDGTVEVLPSEARSQSTQDMSIFGINVPAVSYMLREKAWPLLKYVFTGGLSEEARYTRNIGGQRYRYDPFRMEYRKDWIRR
nr:MAG TPA: minor capsid protein [Microviridae sp.]